MLSMNHYELTEGQMDLHKYWPIFKSTSLSKICQNWNNLKDKIINTFYALPTVKLSGMLNKIPSNLR